jgi:hypothetical protein
VTEGGGTPQDRAYRVGFKRSKREDYAVDLFRLALARLGDAGEVNRILVELGRYYNAIADAPLVSLETRQRIMTLLAAGDRAGAGQLIEGCLDRYQVDEHE